MKNTLKETVKEVYNTEKNDNASFNKNLYDYETIVNDVMKNTNDSTTKSESISKPHSLSNIEENVKQTISKPKSSYGIYIFFGILFFISILLSAVFFFKDKIKSFLQKYFNDIESETKIKDLESKIKEQENEKSELQKKIVLNEEKKDKETNEEKNTKVYKNKDNIDNLKQQYSSSQIVSEDSFCFIGNDDNMRHCVEVYKDDICTSGDIYKRMDDCLIPKLNQGMNQCSY